MPRALRSPLRHAQGECQVTTDRWQRIEELYHSALQRDGSERAAYLQHACAGDEALRQEVESLLAHEQPTKDILETLVPEIATEALAKDRGQSMIGRRLGSYQVVLLLGVGGMGEVYQAHDTKLGRNVAIKVLPSAFEYDPERLGRLRREARMLAALNHPNIATIYGLEESDG